MGAGIELSGTSRRRLDYVYSRITFECLLRFAKGWNGKADRNGLALVSGQLCRIRLT